jgi:hypothetical protein
MVGVSPSHSPDFPETERGRSRALDGRWLVIKSAGGHSRNNPGQLRNATLPGASVGASGIPQCSADQGDKDGDLRREDRHAEVASQQEGALWI